MEKIKKTYSYDILDKENSVASVTECTGLIQIPPTTEAEAEAYSDIYVVPKQVNDIERLEKKREGVVLEKMKCVK